MPTTTRPRLTWTVTRSTTVTTTVPITASEIRKRFRLPDNAVIRTVNAHEELSEATLGDDEMTALEARYETTKDGSR